MMSADEYRGKARESLDFAKRATSAHGKAEWKAMARAWRELGVRADYQERMEYDWLTSG